MIGHEDKRLTLGSLERRNVSRRFNFADRVA